MNELNILALAGADPGFMPGLARLYDIKQGSAEFDGLVDDLSAFCRSMAPVPIALRDPLTIKPLLDGFRKQREQASQRPTNFLVIFLDGLLFKRIEDGEIMTTHSYNECAAFADTVAAREAGRRLDGMGNFAVRVTRITNEIRNPESISSKLADFGL